MKKTLLVLTGLLVLSVTTIICASATIGAPTDKVEFEETVLYGDPSEVEGVRVYRNLKWEDVMYWRATHILGAPSQTLTEYDFHMYKAPEPYEFEREILAFIDANEFYGLDSETATDSGVKKALLELLKETPNGETAEKIIQLYDYSDYYTFGLQIDMEDWGILIEKDEKIGFKTSEELAEQQKILACFNEFFRVPVIENEVYRIGIKKDDNGNAMAYYYGQDGVRRFEGTIDCTTELPKDADHFFFEIEAIRTSDTCYFTFLPYTSCGTLVDTSLIPGGYGIYSFKFGNETIDTDSLKLVYAMQPSNYVDLELDKQGQNLLIFHAEKNELGDKEKVLTVLDLTTEEEKQTLCYGIAKGKRISGCYWIYDNFIVVPYDTSGAALLSRTENGTYELKFNIPSKIWSVSGDTDFLNAANAFDYNGEKLLVVGGNQKASSDHILKDYYYNPLTGEDEVVYLRYMPVCGFFLGVFDENGLSFYAEYECNLDTELYSEKVCTTTLTDFIDVSWPEEKP